MAAERAKIRAALEARLVGTIKEPEHDTDLFCWCRKSVQRVKGTGTDLVMHGTVDEFIKAALDEVFGTGVKL
ncbi:MAG TPA: hypothetical protein PL074_02100 [Thermoflexales bacterium]|nr:hypothetical protein [Thermoflexales bacterium]